ncbi:DNA-binding helix-turn-helix protein [Shuttleworthella sp. MSX8B]|uniref:helix-turn-helix transcriptional regulator n=1 Tax=Shuttleworthella sp. MSX8B TaxID=936574 RepID=UPI0004529E4A|nr:helix-turn-helix transcriptional regulator [Shuttleworthia sp. MSX8B]EUB18188.1 DNA-binding helix-turn-helix protein [Shuttleworthia sp. MSX8B]
MAVQNHLKECRLASGRTQGEVSQAIQANINTISRYELGENCPSLEMALRLAAYYQKTIEELFELEDGNQKG